MTANYQYYDEDWSENEWLSTRDSFDYPIEPPSGLPLDVVAIFAVLVVILGLIFAARTLLWNSSEQPITPSLSSQPDIQLDSEKSSPLSPPILGKTDIILPYDDYIITQGIHGQAYGHMAIDIAAGKGEIIKSPISGTVTELFFDAIGNPTLVIENEKYRITMLHGNFSVAIGDTLTLGDPVGTEGNLGNTRDMQGVSCRNRDCGYHTHLNVFDKEISSNVNPLEAIGN